MNNTANRKTNGNLLYVRLFHHINVEKVAERGKSYEEEVTLSNSILFCAFKPNKNAINILIRLRSDDFNQELVRCVCSRRLTRRGVTFSGSLRS